MKRTYQELIQLAQRLGASEAFITSAGLPIALRTMAENCFLEKTPESDDTRLLRYQLRHLNNHGYFNLSE